MEETLETASSEGADSDFYEAHAVLLNLKRKQMDSAGGMLAIARATKDTELRTAASEFQKAQKASAQALTDGVGCLRRQDRDRNCGVTTLGSDSRPAASLDEPGIESPEETHMTERKRSQAQQADLDPGAYIGHEPEREAESIPGGVRADDERIAAHSSRVGADGEPESVPDGTDR